MPNPRQPDVITVAVTRADGGLTVLRVVTAEYRPDGLGGRVASWTIDPTDEYIEAIIKKHDWKGPQAPVSWRRVSNSFVDESTDHTFRDAWKDGIDTPDVDMVKAREIHRKRLRNMRAPLLEALDTEYMKADEDGRAQDKKDIAARKQALRDVTDDPAIDAASTPEELKAVIPSVLRAG